MLQSYLPQPRRRRPSTKVVAGDPRTREQRTGAMVLQELRDRKKPAVRLAECARQRKTAELSRPTPAKLRAAATLRPASASPARGDATPTAAHEMIYTPMSPPRTCAATPAPGPRSTSPDLQNIELDMAQMFPPHYQRGPSGEVAKNITNKSPVVDWERVAMLKRRKKQEREEVLSDFEAFGGILVKQRDDDDDDSDTTAPSGKVRRAQSLPLNIAPDATDSGSDADAESQRSTGGGGSFKSPSSAAGGGNGVDVCSITVTLSPDIRPSQPPARTPASPFVPSPPPPAPVKSPTASSTHLEVPGGCATPPRVHQRHLRMNKTHSFLDTLRDYSRPGDHPDGDNPAPIAVRHDDGTPIESWTRMQDKTHPYWAIECPPTVTVEQFNFVRMFTRDMAQHKDLLLYLSLRNFKLTACMLSHCLPVAGQCRFLTTLKVTRCGLADTHLYMLLHHMPSYLTALDVGYNALSIRGVGFFLRSLTDANKNVKSLSLRANNQRQESALAFCDVLKKCLTSPDCALIDLDVSFLGVCDDGLLVLAGFLPDVCDLQRLSLDGSPVTLSACSRLLDALKENSSLTYLSLMHCRYVPRAMTDAFDEVLKRPRRSPAAYRELCAGDNSPVDDELDAARVSRHPLRTLRAFTSNDPSLRVEVVSVHEDIEMAIEEGSDDSAFDGFAAAHSVEIDHMGVDPRTPLNLAPLEAFDVDAAVSEACSSVQQTPLKASQVKFKFQRERAEAAPEDPVGPPRRQGRVDARTSKRAPAPPLHPGKGASTLADVVPWTLASPIEPSLDAVAVPTPPVQPLSSTALNKLRHEARARQAARHESIMLSSPLMQSMKSLATPLRPHARPQGRTFDHPSPG